MNKRPCELPSMYQCTISVLYLVFILMPVISTAGLYGDLSGLTPLSLGYEAPNGQMITILRRHSLIPSKQTMQMVPVHIGIDHQLALSFYQGEFIQAKRNSLFDTISVIVPSTISADQCITVDIIFVIDVVGVYTITIIDPHSGWQHTQKLKQPSPLSAIQIAHMMLKAQAERQWQQQQVHQPQHLYLQAEQYTPSYPLAPLVCLNLWNSASPLSASHQRILPSENDIARWIYIYQNWLLQLISLQSIDGHYALTEDIINILRVISVVSNWYMVPGAPLSVIDMIRPCVKQGSSAADVEGNKIATALIAHVFHLIEAQSIFLGKPVISNATVSAGKLSNTQNFMNRTHAWLHSNGIHGTQDFLQSVQWSCPLEVEQKKQDVAMPTFHTGHGNVDSLNLSHDVSTQT